MALLARKGCKGHRARCDRTVADGNHFVCRLFFRLRHFRTLNLPRVAVDHVRPGSLSGTVWEENVCGRTWPRFFCGRGGVWGWANRVSSLHRIGLHRSIISSKHSCSSRSISGTLATFNVQFVIESDRAKPWEAARYHMLPSAASRRRWYVRTTRCT